MSNLKQSKWRALLFCLLISGAKLSAQTDADAIMMDKNNFCIGGMYSYSSWKNYYEGTLKRNNQNLGTVSTQMASVMGNYGISNKLNVMAGLPYVSTKASAGTLHPQKGIQDLSAWVKYMPVETAFAKGVLSVYGILGGSIPMTNYVCDYLPLSIGLHSKTLTLRAMVDYQKGAFFATLAGSYVFRSDITLDRDQYYTTSMHYTNKVDMPNQSQYELRLGYRTDRMIAEAVFNNTTTLGGFDITRNNMPFPSNRMNMTMAGIHIKYNIKPVDGLSVNADASFTPGLQGIKGTTIGLAARNVGQATMIGGGIFYIVSFAHHPKSTANTPAKN